MYEAQCAGGPLSVSLFLFGPFSKCILRQITLISECYEADKRRNKAQTIRRDECDIQVDFRAGGRGNIIRDLQRKKTTFVPLISGYLDIKRRALKEMKAKSREAAVRNLSQPLQPRRRPPLRSIPTALQDL